MKIAYFTHSLASCWNHGNAHFLRGVLRELIAAGHEVSAFEPRTPGAWSTCCRTTARWGCARYRRRLSGAAFAIVTARSGPAELCADADVVIVHEWNEPSVVAASGAARPRRPASRCCSTTPTTARSASPRPCGPTTCRPTTGCWPSARRCRGLPRLGLGRARLDLARGRRHAAVPSARRGGPARRDRLDRQLGATTSAPRSWSSSCFRPARTTGVALDIYGVRYPGRAQATLSPYGVALPRLARPIRMRRGSSRAAMTVHVPRRFYTRSLPGIPTIRVFEALACGIPLLSAPWSDSEDLFRPGGRLPLRPRRGRDGRAHARGPRRRRAAPVPGQPRSGDHPGPPHLRPPRAGAARLGALRAHSGRGTEAGREDRFLRLQPAVVLLERRGHLLPGGSCTTSPGAGWDIHFYEPDAFDRQKHRDMDPPDGPRSRSGRRPRRTPAASPPRPPMPTWWSRPRAWASSTTIC
jgi:hypothetical protein